MEGFSTFTVIYCLVTIITSAIQNTRRERIFATAVWMCTGVLQNQNKLARVAQGYGKRRGVVTNFIVTLNNLYLLKNNVERQSIY